MIKNKTVLAIIPARGGSKGVPRKNIRELGGKPLIAWTIEAAKKSNYIDRLILSSEDPEIIAIAKQWGCEVPFVRPQELAQDETPGIDPILHGIETLQEKYDYVILLQVTSPLRTVEDIDGCLELAIREDAISCVSVTEPDKSPYWMYKMSKGNYRLDPLIPQDRDFSCRQELPEVYALNGAIYVNRCEDLLKTKKMIQSETIGYIMPKERSIDIDTEADLIFLNYIMEKNK